MNIMKRIIAALTGKVENMKMERKVARVNRSIETASDNAQDAIDRIEEEKADLLAQLAESTEVNDIITKIADKIGEAEEQEAIIARLNKVKKYINEDVEVEDESGSNSNK